MFAILGLICILLGFIVGIFDKVDIVFDSLEWFVAAIAFNTLGEIVFPAVVRRKDA